MLSVLTSRFPAAGHVCRQRCGPGELLHQYYLSGRLGTGSVQTAKPAMLAEGPLMRELREARDGAVQDGSRHRYQYKPPDTPNQFWDMGFGDSLDSPSKGSQPAADSLSLTS